MNLIDAINSYHTAKLKDIYPPKDIFNNFLAFAAGLGEQGSGSYPPRAHEPPSDIEAAFEIYEDAKKKGASLSEASYSGLIRCCALNNRKEDGLQLLHEMLAIPLTPRNRTYSALLNSYCHAGNKEISLNLFHELSEKYHLPVLERDYISLLHLASIYNDSNLFYSMLHSMMEDILIPQSSELWKILIQWFSMPTRNEKYSILKSKIISEDGLLEECEYKLKSIELTKENKLQLLLQIEKTIIGDPHECATTSTSSTNTRQQDGQPKTKKRVNRIMTSHEKWNEFKAWIDLLENEITEYSQQYSCLGKDKYVLIDGANVGFYQQNYANAPNHVNYHQIQAIVTYFQSINMIPIVILHCRHIAPETVPSHCLELINYWKSSNNKNNSPNLRFYFTPGGYNDDIFWLYSTVKLDIHIVTNDEMRDHHFQMLSPKWFIRWKDRHQIHFTFGKLANKCEIGRKEDHQNSVEEEGNESTSGTGGSTSNVVHLREVTLTFPLKYSHRMQIYTSNDDPTAINRGLFECSATDDDIQTKIHQEHDGYFIPLENEENWLCIIPKNIVR